MDKYYKEFELNDNDLAIIETTVSKFNLSNSSCDDDCDCSKETIEFYKELNWIDEDKMSFLEPSPCFLTWMIERHLLKLVDNGFYQENFRNFVEESGSSYDYVSDHEAHKLRFQWIALPEVKEHYNNIFTNEIVINFVNVTHYPGNFIILPKGFSWNPKVTQFNDSFITTLEHLETNWRGYALDYEIKTFEEFKKAFFLDVFYKNGKLDKSLAIDFKNDSLQTILERLERIYFAINIRSHEICKSLKK